MMQSALLRLLGIATVVAVTGTVHAQDWAEKMFERDKIDFGVVARGSDAVFRLKVSNSYVEECHIANVRTTCGCSAAKPSQTTLKSREEAFIEVTMNTRKFTHRKDSNVIVTFDKPFFAEVRIPVTAYIRTDVVLEPGAAAFGPVDVGVGARKTVKVSYAGRSDWLIKDVDVRNPMVSAKAVETSRNGGRITYDLVVELDPSMPVGAVREQIHLVTNDAKSPRVPFLVEARVEADITITPASVSLGRLNSGQRKSFSVVLRGRKPFEIESIEAGSGRGLFSVSLPKQSRIVHVLPLTVTPPDEAGDFEEDFTVKIAGRSEPVRFSARGMVENAK